MGPRAGMEPMPLPILCIVVSNVKSVLLPYISISVTCRTYAGAIFLTTMNNVWLYNGDILLRMLNKVLLQQDSIISKRIASKQGCRVSNRQVTSAFTYGGRREGVNFLHSLPP